ncbi:MAG: DNA repair protein RecO [Anaerovoracaceae bacterium]|jgi:DNA repair protein RecO (recombination protein O)
MYAETEGIVLKQTKIANDRRMLVIFTKRYGKISAGTSISERRKGRSALALRPFAYGKYQINKSGDNYHINDCEIISSHFSLGDDIDKFFCASYGMEFTDKLLPEEAAAPKLFSLLREFLDMMEKRTKKYDTLLVAYLVKALALNGNSPLLDTCALCGSEENLTGFSVADGGTVCESCRLRADDKEQLIYEAGFDIVGVIQFLTQRPLSQLENLALDDGILEWIKRVLRSYIEYHLDIRCLKSEEFMDCR